MKCYKGLLGLQAVIFIQLKLVQSKKNNSKQGTSFAFMAYYEVNRERKQHGHEQRQIYCRNVFAHLFNAVYVNMFFFLSLCRSR